MLASPVANDDSYTVVHDRMLEVEAEDGLLANDTDPEGDPLQVSFVSQPSNGSCTFQEATPYGDGSFRYLPDAGFVGNDSFTYKISDGTSESNLATVTITVTNSVPTAQPDQYTIFEDQVLQVGDSGGGTLPPPGVPPGTGGASLLANDTDDDDDILRTELETDVSSGSLVLRDNGSFTYTPAPNFAGADSFTYSVTDGVVSSAPATVTITVQPGGSFDLDGHDESTLTSWMSEPDEADYGLGVGIGHSATIFTRVYNLPSNMVVDSRRLSFDPNVLSVDGVDEPGYIELSPGGGNEVLDVSALVLGYDTTSIAYEIFSHVNNGGPLGEEFATLVVMQVVEQTAVLEKLEFTSDHNVLRENTKDPTKSGNRYSDVEFVRAKKGHNFPMTHTRHYNTPGLESKIKVKVAFNWTPGIPANTPFKLVGTSSEQALIFESAVLLLNDGLPNPELTATNNVGTEIRTINASIDWSMVLNPGPNQTVLPMGKSGAHKIYVLFGVPHAQERAAFQATDIRMDRTVEVMSAAVTKARAAVAPAGPTWQRVVFEVAQLQKFNRKTPIVPAPWMEENLKNGWKVFDTWTAAEPGADCFSGAVFSWLVVASAGTLGEQKADAFAAKSGTEPTKAVPYVVNDPARLRMTANAPGIQQALTHVTVGPLGAVVHDYFEGALVYTPPGGGAATFYFPVGVGDTRYTNPDHVLTVFTRPAWVIAANGIVIEELPLYVRAQNAIID